MIKVIIGNMLALFLFMYCSIAFSDKISITGRPYVLQYHRDVFTLPPSYTARREYLFVSVAGVHRVCYLDKQPELASLDFISIVIEQKDVKMLWNCYRYDPKFFELDY